LTVKVSDSKGWDNVGYAVLFFNDSSSTLGAIEDRGGRFDPGHHYVANLALGPAKAFEKRDQGQFNAIAVTGTRGLYLDASDSVFRQDPKDSTVRCRFRFLGNAAPGKWSVRGYLKSGEEVSSGLFYRTFELTDQPPAPSRAGGLRMAVPAAAGVIALALLILWKRRRRGAPIPTRDQESFSKFAAFVAANLDKDLSMAEIGRHMIMGYDTLYRIVKSVTGNSIKSYILNEKMKRAEELLKTTNKNVSEIMMAVGFSDAAYFSKMFKKATGKSPRLYREKRAA
jgi:AraC-like DNA-binding protein